MTETSIAASALVDAVISALIDSWNRHDMVAYAAQFHPQADFVNVLGMHWHGRQEIETTHVNLHRTIFRNSILQKEAHAVRFLSSTIALAHVNWQMTGAEGMTGWDVAAVRHGVMTLVLVEDDGQWLITAAHNTDIVPLAMPK